jgi:hypothetical protein
MKEVTLKIPEGKLQFFLELVQYLGFEVAQNQDIPEAHQHLVHERLATVQEENLIPWEKAKKSLRKKGKA